MKRTILLFLVSILCAALFFSSALAEESSQDPKALENKVERIEDSLANLKDMVKELSFEVDETRNFQSVLKEVSYETKYNQSEIKGLLKFKKMVTDQMQPKLLALENTVSELSKTMNTYQKKVLDLESTVDNLSVEISNNKSSLTKLSQELKVLKANFEGFNHDFKQEIKRLEAEIEEAPLKSMQVVWAKIDELKKQISDLELNKADKQEIQDSLSQFEKKLDQELGQFQSSLEETQKQAETTYMLSIGGLLAGVAALALYFMQG